MFILDDIFLFPLKGVAYIAQKIAEQVELEQNDETTVRKKLLELQLLYEMDEITEEEYDRREAELIRRLKAAKLRAQDDLDEIDDVDEIDDADDVGDTDNTDVT